MTTALAQPYLDILHRAERAGSSGIARLREFVSLDRVEEYPAIAAAREEVLAEAFGATPPAVVTTVVDRLWENGSPIRIEVGEIDSPDGAVYLPGVLPIDGAGEVVAPGDFRGQYTWCLQRAGELLDALGLNLSHLVQTIDFSTPATREVYPRCGRPRRDLLGPVYPGAAGILLSRLPHPDVLVAFEFVASRYLPHPVNPGWARYHTLTYNPAVRAGSGLYGSGFAALDPVSQLAVHDGDAAAQTRYTYESILAVLAAAGAGPEHLVRVDEYICPAGVDARQVIAAVRSDMLGEATPAMSTVGCATLLRPQFLLEVIPTAILPK